MKEHDRTSVGWVNRVGAFGVAEVLKHPCRSGPECSARSPLQAHELLLSALTASSWFLAVNDFQLNDTNDGLRGNYQIHQSRSSAHVLNHS